MPTRIPLGQALSSAAFDRVRDELGNADREALQKVIALVKQDGLIGLHSALTTLYPSRSEQEALSLFRGLRMRLRAAANLTAPPLDLDLKVDSEKRSPTSARHCWFEGEDIRRATIAAGQAKLTAQGEIVRPSIMETRDGKPLVRYFISYARSETHVVNPLMDMLKQRFRSSRHYVYVPWKDVDDVVLGERWHEEIQAAIQQCHVGLAFVSAAFFSRDYIRDHELPKFVPRKGDNGDELKKLLPVALKQVMGAGIDLRGLDQFQVFHLDRFTRGGAVAQRAWEDVTKASDKTLFANRLFNQIERFIAAQVWQAPDTTMYFGAQKQLHLEVSKHQNADASDHADEPEDETEEPATQENSTATTGTVPVPERTPNWVPSHMGEGTQIKSPGAEATEPQDRSPAQARKDAVKTLMEWAFPADPQKPSEDYCVLLGELGTGKTTTSRELANTLHELRTTQPKAPMPLYMDLRLLGVDVKNDLSLDNMLELICKRQWQGGGLKPLLSPEEVVQEVQERGALAIFDGLDEVMVHLDHPQKSQQFLRELLRLLPPPAKPWGTSNPRPAGRGRLLLTCRTHIFRTLRDQQTFFALEDRDRMGQRAEGKQNEAGAQVTSPYRTYEMLPFTPEQVKAYFKQVLPDQDPAQLYALVESVHNLAEMAERPYLLSLIVQSLDKVREWREQGKQVSQVTLYRHVALSWLERDDGKHHLTRDHLMALMERAAAMLWDKGRRTWTAKQMDQWLIDFLIDNPRVNAHYEGVSRELLKLDLRTATFLVREGENTFRFAHTSLQEFFVASRLASTLVEGQPEAWQVRGVSEETLDFLGQLLDELAASAWQRAQNTFDTLKAQYQPVRSELLLRYTLFATDKGYRYAALNGVQLPGIELQGWKFAGTAEKPLQLAGANFSGAQLTDCEFAHVNLQGAHFSAAKLDGTAFQHVAAQSTQWQQAVLYGAHLRHVDFDNATLTGIEQRHTAWAHCVHAEAAAPAAWRVPGMVEPNVTAQWDWYVGHFREVSCVAPLGEGSRIVSGSWDNTLRLWDTHSGQCLRVFEGHKNWVTSVSPLGDGSRFVSGSYDYTLRLWDTNTGQCLRVFEGHKSTATSVAPLGDGSRILSGSHDNTLRLWDTHSGQCLRVFEGHDSDVTSVAPLSNGSRIISGSWDNTLRLWDANTGKCLKVIHPHKRNQWLTYEPDTREILAASPEAWRYLRWHLDNPPEGDDGLRPAEFFGPLPTGDELAETTD
jgi:uncharacterized protein YjbI with pentapeptide repeats